MTVKLPQLHRPPGMKRGESVPAVAGAAPVTICLTIVCRESASIHTFSRSSGLAPAARRTILEPTIAIITYPANVGGPPQLSDRVQLVRVAPRANPGRRPLTIQQWVFLVLRSATGILSILHQPEEPVAVQTYRPRRMPRLLPVSLGQPEARISPSVSAGRTLTHPPVLSQPQTGLDLTSVVSSRPSGSARQRPDVDFSESYIYAGGTHLPSR